MDESADEPAETPEDDSPREQANPIPTNGAGPAGQEPEELEELEETAKPPVERPRPESIRVAALGKNPSMGDVWSAASTRSLHSLLTLTNSMVTEPGDDSARAVHKSRVAIRSLRSQLRCFAPLMVKSQADPEANIVGGLKRLSRSLGEVRDLDVLLVSMRKLAETKPLPTGSEQLFAVTEGERQAAYERLQHDLLAPWCTETLQDLVSLVNDPPLRKRAGKAATPERMAALAAGPFARIDARVSKLSATPSAAELHRVRLAVKGARYAIVGTTAIVGGKAKRTATQLALMQDLLGKSNDANIFGDALREIGSLLDADGAFCAGHVAGLLSSDHAPAPGDTSDTEAWRAQWKKVSSAKSTKWLLG